MNLSILVDDFFSLLHTKKKCAKLCCMRIATWRVINTSPLADPYDYAEVCRQHISSIVDDESDRYKLERIF